MERGNKMAKNKTYNAQEEFQIFNDFEKDDIAEYLNKKIRQANRQLTRLENADVYSSAYQRAQADIGKSADRFMFVDSETNIEQMKSTYARVLDFLRSPSATVTGAREQEKIARNFFKEEHNLKFRNKEQFDEFYKALHSAEYGRAQLTGRLDSGTLNDEIHEAIQNGVCAQDIISTMQRYATNELTIDEFQELVNEERGIKWNE